MNRTRIEVITAVLNAVNSSGSMGSTRIQYLANLGYKRCKTILDNLDKFGFIKIRDDVGRSRRKKEYYITTEGTRLLVKLKDIVYIILKYREIFGD